MEECHLTTLSHLLPVSLGVIPSAACVREMIQSKLMYGLKDVGKVDLDRDWRKSIHEIRAVLISERPSTNVPLSSTLLDEVIRVAVHVLPQEFIGELKTVLGTILRNMLNIGGNLGQSKEYR